MKFNLFRVKFNGRLHNEHGKFREISTGINSSAKDAEMLSERFSDYQSEEFKQIARAYEIQDIFSIQLLNS